MTLDEEAGLRAREGAGWLMLMRLHRSRPGHYLAPSRCFGTKRDGQQHAYKLQTHRPITASGGAWPTLAATQTWELKKFN
ncbi:DUF1589 domain-containing protein [Rhodopirellula bahusiensis]|uniref:DUF1589 domain-containing protein n=1 Tax=Rhodopirellula bahusiensis TaxID=2014065 RepID=UPI0032648FDE